ncbi:hypothetical protein MMC14_009147, partial [Varicellaria rhodocarpa]|nr:hypothetical protein [Varicellaria rhodocarpa]
MPGEKASIDLLFLDDVHEALAKSLLSQDRVTSIDEEVEVKLAQPHEESEIITKPVPDTGATLGDYSNLKELQKRDPLSEEVFFSEEDLATFVNNLDSQLELRRLSPTMTGKGFVAVVFRRGLNKNTSLKDEILKLLEPLSSLQLAKESRRLSRIHSPGNHWDDQGGDHHIGSHNAAWFAYLDDILADPWTLFHEDIDLTDPPNFWEILR